MDEWYGFTIWMQNWCNNLFALNVKTRGDFVLVGDLLGLFTLFQLKQMEGSFEEMAGDYETNWTTIVEII